MAESRQAGEGPCCRHQIKRMDTRHLVFVYEPEQVDSVLAYAASHDVTIVTMDYWVEQELVSRGVSFESAEHRAPSPEETDVLFAAAQTAAREWYRSPEMQFFSHRGISLGEALEPNLDSYFQFLLHCLPRMDAAIQAHAPVAAVAVPYSHKVLLPTSAPLLPSQFNVPVDIAHLLANSYGYIVETIGEAYRTDAIQPFPPQNLRHRIAIQLCNALINLFPAKRHRIYASEDWTHIRPFSCLLPDTGIVLMDQSELRKVSWRNLVQSRIRFRDPVLDAGARPRAIAQEEMLRLREQWPHARAVIKDMSVFSWRDRSWWPIVEDALDFVVTVYAERVIAGIEGAVSLLTQERTEVLILRASVSAQPLFFVLAQVAKALGVPSIEVQHAGAVLDPRSVHARLETSYLAAYGAATVTGYVGKGYDASRLVQIGSPRFDTYGPALGDIHKTRNERVHALRLDPFRPIILIVVPKEGPPLTLAPWHPTSYDVASLLYVLAAVRDRIPGAQFIFKFRKKGTTPHHRALIAKLFPADVVVSEDDLFSMIAVSDIVVSAMSTALYEGMIAKKPLVLFPWKPDAFHNHIYEAIAPIVWTQETLTSELHRLINDQSFREKRLLSQERFLAAGYLFDGHASERMGLWLRSFFDKTAVPDTVLVFSARPPAMSLLRDFLLRK